MGLDISEFIIKVYINQQFLQGLQNPKLYKTLNYIKPQNYLFRFQTDSHIQISAQKDRSVKIKKKRKLAKEQRKQQAMKTLKIYLNIYDFTQANSYLSQLGIGGYHTGVEINNKEYCFCVISTDPNQSGVIVIDPQSADYTFNRKIYLGETQLRQQQFVKILENLAKKFACGKYNIFSNNCNHFSQQMVRRLLKVNIPKWIFRTTNILDFMCCCLPTGFVSGRWAIQALLKNQGGEFQDYLNNMN